MHSLIIIHVHEHILADKDPTITGDTLTISETATSQSILTLDVADADTTDITADPFSVTITGSSQFSIVTTATGCKSLNSIKLFFL